MRMVKQTVFFILCIPLLITSGCLSYISKEANQKFEARSEAFTVTIFPVSVVTGNLRSGDERLSRDLIDYLSREGLAWAALGRDEISLPVKWGRNQAKMAKNSALGFSEIMKNRQVSTDYSLLVEILCNTDETRVGGVHYYLCDKDGNLADGGLTNSHWDEFHQVKPVNRKGGLEVAKLMLKREWAI